MKRLQADIRAGRLDLILAFKMDRIGRNTVDFRNFEALIKKHEVNLQFFNDRYETDTASDFLANHITMGFAEHERLVIGERTREALEKRARNGLWNGGYIFGYRRDEQTEKLVPHDREAEIIRRHFYDAMEELGSVGRVLQRLHRLGIRYPDQKPDREKGSGGKPFEKQQVRRILENPIYLGHVVWGKIRTENAHPAIVSEEQATRVRAILNQNRNRRSNTRYSRGRQYPLKGLVLCSCGHYMTPKGATGRSGACFYYECSRQIHQQSRADCSSPRIPAVALEDGVKGLLRRIGTYPQARE
jgi:site-specific DNA recombinase